MPNLIDSSFQTTVAGGVGQRFSFKADVDFMQYFIRDTSAQTWEVLIGSSYDPAKSYILKGCVKTSSGGMTTISPGFVFGISKAYGSMVARTYVYYCDGQTFADPVGPDVVIGKIVGYPQGYADPTPFSDGSNHNVHNNYVLEFSAGASGSGDVDYSDLVVLAYAETALTGGSGWTAASAKVRKDVNNVVTLRGGFTITSGPPSPTVTTIPLAFRPVADEYRPATAFDGATTYSTVTIKINASTGALTCTGIATTGNVLYLSDMTYRAD